MFGLTFIGGARKGRLCLSTYPNTCYQSRFVCVVGYLSRRMISMMSVRIIRTKVIPRIMSFFLLASSSLHFEASSERIKVHPCIHKHNIYLLSFLSLQEKL